MQMSVFVQNRQKLEKEIFALCVITSEPIRTQTQYAHQNDRLNLSFVKDNHAVGKKMARNDHKKAIYQCYSFLLRLQFPHYGNFLLHKLNRFGRNYSRGDTIQGRKLFAETRYLENEDALVLRCLYIKQMLLQKIFHFNFQFD